MKPVLKTLVALLVLISVIACSSDKGKQPKSYQTKKTNKPSVGKALKVPSGVVDPDQIAKAQALLQKHNDLDLNLETGKKLFKERCTTCHGIRGDLMLNGAKDLNLLDTNLEKVIAQVYHGKGLMTPFSGLLTEEEILHVSNYAYSLSSD